MAKLVSPDSKPSPDPKKAAGEKKCPMHLLPPTAEELICEILGHGADKYGPFNWRLSDGLQMKTYVAAFRRHINAIARGEWLDPDSGKPHIAHIGAAACVLLDADSVGKLDRECIKPELNDQIHP